MLITESFKSTSSNVLSTLYHSYPLPYVPRVFSYLGNLTISLISDERLDVLGMGLFSYISSFVGLIGKGSYIAIAEFSLTSLSVKSLKAKLSGQLDVCDLPGN